MTLADDIRGRAGRYVAGLDSLDVFEGWFAPVFADVDERRDADAAYLAMAIEGMLSELADGVRSEAEAKGAIRSLIQVVERGIREWVVTPTGTPTVTLAT